jgi:hypothetical protein
MKILVLVILMAAPFLIQAQDSTIVYFDKKGKDTRIKDSAHIYIVVTKQGNLWYGKSYYAKNNLLQSQGTYLKADMRSPVGKFDNYNDEGVLTSTNVYDDKSEMVNRTTYHPNGKKRSYISYGKNGDTFQEGWDEEGNSIPGYVTEREAQFTGGYKAWSRYIATSLIAEAPVDAGEDEGTYRVSVSFQIDKEGNIIDVKADSTTPACHSCTVEALRVIRSGPQWRPAIQFNKPVKQRMQQTVTFVVEEGRRKKRKKKD